MSLQYALQEEISEFALAAAVIVGDDEAARICFAAMMTELIELAATQPDPITAAERWSATLQLGVAAHLDSMARAKDLLARAQTLRA